MFVRVTHEHYHGGIMTRIILALLLWAQPTTSEREREVIAIGEAIEFVAVTHSYDPWRLAALTVKESGVRCDRVGKLGERGPGQVLSKYLKWVTDDELSTPGGGMYGVVEALDTWKRDRPNEDAWSCYASGSRCSAPRAMRRLRRIEAELKGMVTGYELHIGQDVRLDESLVSR